MKQVLTIAVLLGILCVAASAGAKTYQATGQVLAINGDLVTIQKGTEKWEISVPKDTKGAADLKVGEKITVQYTMTATSVEPKAEKKTAPKKAESKKPAATTATPK